MGRPRRNLYDNRELTMSNTTIHKGLMATSSAKNGGIPVIPCGAGDVNKTVVCPLVLYSDLLCGGVHLNQTRPRIYGDHHLT